MGRSRPRNHCAINVGIYGRGLTYWAMTERSEDDVVAAPDLLQIGPSAVTWDGNRVRVTIDELTAPLPRRVRGTITLEPQAAFGEPVTLGAEGSHVWWPIAPVARVSVDLEHPNLRWQGYGYMDSNRGEEPLEDGVKTWTWSRVSLPGRNGAGGPPDVAVLYDLVRRRDGSQLCFGRRFGGAGEVEAFDPPAAQPLPTSLWQMKRAVPSEPDQKAPKVIRTAEDSPFYTRSIIRTGLEGGYHLAMHESLNMDRFNRWWMKCLMPVRMPRRFL